MPTPPAQDAPAPRTLSPAALEHAETVLAALLGVPDHTVAAAPGPIGGAILTTRHPVTLRRLAFWAEPDSARPGAAAAATRFHLLAACLGCEQRCPEREIRRRADLDVRHAPVHPASRAPHSADPVWHAPACPFAEH